MKKLMLLVFTILLASCGSDYVHTTSVKEVEVPTFVAQDFEGYWYCDNNSNVELIADFQDRITFETTGQSLNSTNPVSAQLGTHPTIGERDLVLNGKKLIVNPRNYNYSSSTHDLETDVGGANITGNHRTDILIELKNPSKLTIKILIYQGALNTNINSIIAERKFTCTL